MTSPLIRMPGAMESRRGVRPARLTPARLEHLGRSLYGTRWKGALADALGVHKRVVQRWITGYFQIPNSLGDEIQQLINDRTRG